MKGLSWIAILLLLAVFGCGESTSKVFPLPNHAGKSGLKGEVESLLEEEFLVHPMTGGWEEDPYNVLRFDYGSAGQLVRRYEKHGSALAILDTMLYGTDGLLHEHLKRNRGNGHLDKRLFLYDELGREAEEQVFNEAGKLKRQEKTKYNEGGEISERFTLQQIKRHAQAPLELRNRDLYEYSEAGILSEHQRFEREVLILEEAYTNGNLVQEKRFNPETGALEVLREVQWSRDARKGLGEERDALGRLLQRDTTLLDEMGREVYRAEADSTGELNLRVKRVYDPFGSLIEEVYAVRGRSVPSAKSMTSMFRDTVRYDFVYDEQGNWTQSDRMRNGEPDVRIRRSITYHNL